MEIQAIGKYLRISPRKLVTVAALVKKKKAVEALAHLRFVNKKGAKFVSQVLASAIANAKNNLKLVENNLVIKKIEVQKGPMLKRFQPVSRGRAHPILKRMSHLKVVLESTEERKVETQKTVEKTSHQIVEQEKAKSTQPKKKEVT